jgi:hypothetical protein
MALLFEKEKAGSLEQPKLSCAQEGLSTAAHTQFVVRPFDICLDCAWSKHEVLGDLLIGLAEGDQVQNL